MRVYCRLASTLSTWRTGRLAGYYMTMYSLGTNLELNDEEREIAASQLEIAVRLLSMRPTGEKYAVVEEMVRQLKLADENKDMPQFKLYKNMLYHYMDV